MFTIEQFESALGTIVVSEGDLMAASFKVPIAHNVPMLDDQLQMGGQ